MSTATSEAADRLASVPGAAVAAAREGDAVMAEDGAVGEIEGLVRSETWEPAYLIVRAGTTLRRRYPVVPVSLISCVDPRRRLVELRGRRDAIRRLPETVPLVL